MCGIVGLYIKDRALEPELGGLLARMLGTMCDRGPDSAGFAVYGAEPPGCLKLTIRAQAGYDFRHLIHCLNAVAGTALSHVIRDTHLIIAAPIAREAAVRAEVANSLELTVVGSGRRME